MSGVIDTNILLFAVNKDCPEHGSAFDFLEGIKGRGGRYYLTEGICYEFLRVATHKKVFPSPLGAVDALSFLKLLLGSSRVDVLSAGPSHWQILDELLDQMSSPSGNLFFDIRTVALMREWGVGTIYTADTDFLKFPDLKVVDPLRKTA